MADWRDSLSARSPRATSTRSGNAAWPGSLVRTRTRSPDSASSLVTSRPTFPAAPMTRSISFPLSCDGSISIGSNLNGADLDGQGIPGYDDRVTEEPGEPRGFDPIGRQVHLTARATRALLDPALATAGAPFAACTMLRTLNA